MTAAGSTVLYAQQSVQAQFRGVLERLTLIGLAGAAPFIRRIATGHIRPRSRRINLTGCRIALLRMGKRSSRHASGNGSTNRQNAVVHHRLTLDPKPHRTVNGR